MIEFYKARECLANDHRTLHGRLPSACVLAVLIVSLSLLCGCESKKQFTTTKSESGSYRPSAGRYVPSGSDARVALDTQTGRLCRTTAKANDHPDLPQCGEASVESEQLQEVDADTSKWNSAEVKATCFSRKDLIAWYPLDGGKNIPLICTVENLTGKAVPLSEYDKVEALFRLPDSRVVRSRAYLSSRQKEIPAHGEIEGGLTVDRNCTLSESNYDCVQTQLMKAKELLLTDKVHGVRYLVLIE